MIPEPIAHGILASLILAYFTIASIIMIYASRLPDAPRNPITKALGCIILGLIWPVSLIAEWLHRRSEDL